MNLNDTYFGHMVLYNKCIEQLRYFILALQTINLLLS